MNVKPVQERVREGLTSSIEKIMLLRGFNMHGGHDSISTTVVRKEDGGKERLCGVQTLSIGGLQSSRGWEVSIGKRTREKREAAPRKEFSHAVAPISAENTGYTGTNAAAMPMARRDQGRLKQAAAHLQTD